MRSLRKINNLGGKRVLVRCDFDVPLGKKGQILDDFRIKKAIPTLRYLIDAKAKIILLGHAGRPKGKVVETLRLTPIQNKLTEYLGTAVVKASDCLGPQVEKLVRKMKAGEVLLLENLRFHQGEEKNSKDFAEKLAALGDFYVNNAFANSHRDHASMTGIPKYLPSAAGFTLLRETEVLSNLMKNPKKPLVAIIGGAKIEKAKLKLINKFSEEGGWILIGGLVKKGIEEKGIKLNYPEKVIRPVEKTIGEDITAETVNLFRKKIKKAKTVFWDGVLGKIEEKKFQTGSEEIARAIIKSGAFSVIGGGDTVGFINKLGLAGKFGHVSTGGGAMLAFLAGEELPGLKALDR